MRLLRFILLLLTLAGPVVSAPSLTLLDPAFVARATPTATATDLYFTNVVVLAHMDGTHASTTFTDSSSYGRTLTAFGQAQLTTVQQKFGSASALFDGSQDCITMAAAAEMDLGTNDFTVECWFYTLTTSGSADILSQREDSSQTYDVNSFLIYRNAAAVQVYLSSDGATWDIASAVNIATGLSANTWYHVALVRNGTAFKGYVNGVGTAVATSAAAVSYNTVPFRIGINRVIEYWSGLIDEARFTVGTARYTSDFTPTGPFPNQ